MDGIVCALVILALNDGPVISVVVASVLVLAGNVNVVDPAAAGAAIVTDPLELPANTILAIMLTPHLLV